MVACLTPDQKVPCSNHVGFSSGQVAKASDLKSDSVWEHRFESCRLRSALKNSVAVFGQDIQSYFNIRHIISSEYFAGQGIF